MLACLHYIVVLFYLQIKNDDVSKAISLLTRVSGIGPAKARELVDSGIKTIDDLKKKREVLTHHQLVGLQYFDDFELKISRQEVAQIEEILNKEITELDESYLGNFQILSSLKIPHIFSGRNSYLKFLVTICGSYRRGKESSGDIDCLISHPDFRTIEEKKFRHGSLLDNVVQRLKSCGLVVDTIACGSTKFMVSGNHLVSTSDNEQVITVFFSDAGSLQTV